MIHNVYEGFVCVCVCMFMPPRGKVKVDCFVDVRSKDSFQETIIDVMTVDVWYFGLHNIKSNCIPIILFNIK